MASIDVGRSSVDSRYPQSRESAQANTVSFTSPFEALASLKLTVALFSFSLVLVLAGTLAQIDHDIWFVVNQYFRTFIAWIDIQVFFPRAWNLPGRFPFPGGWLLGTALAVNLLAAHGMRFKVASSGRPLWIGTALIALGMALTYVVVQSGLGDSVNSELSPAFHNGLWHGLRAALGGGTLTLAYVLALSYRTRGTSTLSALWWLGTVTCAILAAVTFWLFLNPDVRLDASGLRILWQLIKAGGAGLVLLAGCHLVFARRAGIVLLHGGIALLMFSELHTGLTAQEAQMRINEGQTVTFAEDYRAAELAVIDKSGSSEDQVTVVPLWKLRKAVETNETIDHDALPVKLRVIGYMPNASTRLAQPGEETKATAGWGVLRIAEERPISTGASTEQAVDLPAAYVEVLSKDDESSLGTYLLWALPSSAAMTEAFKLDGKPFEIEMRFKRLPKPYSVKLLEFRHDRYVGTDTPKNFSSEVQLTDPENNVDRTVKIWMNNPLRYGGDTLYQASFDKDNPQVTVLQVMTNTGWMIPYVSCMLVGAGMMYHFGLTFYRFTNRKVDPKKTTERTSVLGLFRDWRSPAVWVPAGILLLFVLWVGSRARPATQPVTEMQIHEFGKLPLAYDGRIQPFDTLARNMLTVLSGQGKLEKPLEQPTLASTVMNIKPKEPAILWLLDYISGKKEAQHHRVLRIDNPEVLQTLDLETRDGFRYSVAELVTRGDEVMKQWKLASELPQEQRTLAQQKFLELGRKISLLNMLQDSFDSPALRTDSMENFQADFAKLNQSVQRLDQGAPRPIPPVDPEQPWQTMLAAERDYLVHRISDQQTNAATPALRAILEAYGKGDIQEFNSAVADYRKIVEERAAADQLYETQVVSEDSVGERKVAERLSLDRVNFEAYFNHFNPFVLAMALYLICFVLSASSWLGWTTILNRSANWLLWFTFLLHTFALVARIYISGRPPVTNLYSSAVFIGWGAVLFALVFEHVYRRGLGNLLATIVGFPTLFVAYNLAADGDTFMVLQAVLDTQFWLATHVVTITLGYSTTFLAGGMGIVYVVMGLFLKKLDEESRKQLIRMTYGTLCFAIFFSFVGTVLGGLWADDSWGRFWGWDPKENGALMIVIWNALILHARWGGMIAGRGLAVLSIFGNVVTAWSWFGTNLMGVGLHAYGFKEGGTWWLVLFALSQLAVMGLGVLCSDITRAKKKQDESSVAV